MGPLVVRAMITLILVSATAVVLAWGVRRHPAGALALAVRSTLVVLLVALVGFEIVVAARGGWLTLAVMLPLQLCDAATIVAVLALATLDQRLSELLYFWALSGSALALVTPDMSLHASVWEQAAFFGLHGLVIVSAMVLVIGFRRHPRPGAPWRAFVITNVLVVVDAIVDWVLGANYLYLRAKPAHATLLDLMGPWPVYVVAAEALAFVIFWALALPFVRRSPRAGAAVC
jgi:hypothetical integral membrane protein (TIGR02206 family)